MLARSVWQGFGKVLLGGMLLAAPAASFGSVFISVGFAPPVLPVYQQPICPGDGYIWTPGYWAYTDAGYYWVPGVWVQPPTPGFLWTPAYWGFVGGVYRFNPGYWGPHIGFYGGINYGFGYGGAGYEGGYWQNNHFFYNRTVNNINVTNVHNTYIRNVTVVNNVNRVSFNGGNGGIQARPTPQESQFQNEHHVGPTANQVAHRDAAMQDRSQFATANGGHPQTLAQPTTHSAFGNQPGNQINTRAADQQQRINHGVQQGQITPGEARNVQGRENSIQNQTQQDRAANGGHLNQQQRQQIDQRQNNVNQAISNDRHNANNDAAAAQRQQAQQQRDQAQQQRQQVQQQAVQQRNQAQQQRQQERPQSQPQRQEAPRGGGEHEGERPRR